MSITNPQFLNKTVVDVQATYSCKLLAQPIPLVIGTGISQIMSIDSDELVQYERTANGDVSVALLPTIVTGQLFLAPSSATVGAIDALINKYYQITLVPGVITFSSASGGWKYQFTNVIISKPFAGYNLGKVVEDYVFNFKAIPPQGATLAGVANAAGGLINLV